MASIESMRFGVEVMKIFHDWAKDLGYVPTGMINVPELLQFGQRAVLGLLNKRSIMEQCGGDPQEYYFRICANAWCVGLIASKEWHENFDNFSRSDYLDDVINTRQAPSGMAQPIFTKHLKMDAGSFNDFVGTLYLKWSEQMQPHWGKPDVIGRDFTFNAILACYQLGVSMTLERFGFGHGTPGSMTVLPKDGKAASFFARLFKRG